MDIIRGHAFRLGDHVDTDQILPGYAMSYPPEELKKVTLAGSSIPDFAGRVRPGDIILAGQNFGCGSSREQAPLSLASAGVGAVIACSFARIFRRNAINIGLPVLTCGCMEEILDQSGENDIFTVDVANAQLHNQTANKRYSLIPLSATALETLNAGGLINYVKKKLVEGNLNK